MTSYNFSENGNTAEKNIVYGISRSAIVTTILAGESIKNNPVPEHTANPSRKPFIVFRDPVSRKRFGITKKQMKKNVLYTGAPGTGKTTQIRLLLSRLLETQEEGDVIVVFDTKGDYYRAFKRKTDQPVLVIGNEKSYQNETAHWNVFAEFMERDRNGKLRYTRDSDQEAREIARILYTGKESQSQPFFHNAACDITAMVMIGMAREAERTGDTAKLHTCYLARFLKCASREDFLAILEDEHNPDFRSGLEYIGGTGAMTGQDKSVLSSIREMANSRLIGIFGDDPLRGGRTNQEFSMKDLYRSGKKMLVFVEYDMKVGMTLSPLYQLLFDLLLTNGLSQQGGIHKNLYLVLDELKLLNRLTRLEEALNFGRGQNVSIIAGLQDVNQIYALYGKEEGRAILGGFGTLISFRVRDEISREYICSRLGRNQTDISYVVQNQVFHKQRDGFCLEDWDFNELTVGMAAVLLDEESPFLFHFSETV